jgi:hypothetical protein
MLEQNGIPCVTKGEHLRGAVGDLPAFVTWVELWVLDDQDEQEALRLIEAFAPSPEDRSLRLCPKCGAEIEGPFDACWRCGAPLPA